MLYDNALLLGVYGHWWRLTGRSLAERVVVETVEWLTREMLTGEGGFAASLDADSLDSRGHLREGAFYAWDVDQLVAVLGPEDGRWAASTFAVTESGTFEHGLSTLQRPADPDPERLAAVRNRLFQARELRAHPGRDDKVVAAWNGWLIASLVEVAMLFDRPDWLAAARNAADLLWRVHWVDGRLRRTSRDGRVGAALGILEDYAAVVSAYVRLGAATADPTWIERAGALANVLVDQFDDGEGGFYDTAADAEQLYARPRDVTDNATPSGLSSAVQALNLLAEFTGDDACAARAELAAASAGELVRAAPRFAGWLLADAVGRVSTRRPLQVAIVGPANDPTVTAMQRAAYRLAPAGSVLVSGPPDQSGIPLLADRILVGDRPTAYVCRGFVCRLPVTTVADLEAQLAS
jgi:uncharacterized protein YyaL (SSP411 family)